MILASSWLQAIGSLLNVIFILALVSMSGAINRLAGWLTALGGVVVLCISLVEVSLYISSVQSVISGNLTALSVSLILNQAIQHAYVLVPAPLIMLGLGAIILDTRLLPRIFGYLALAFGIAMGVLGIFGLFMPLQAVIDMVLTGQEVWFAAVAIAIALGATKAIEPPPAIQVSAQNPAQNTI
ncbi:hypothetical protein [Dictyobacter kobayashii]|uniref:Uncharacterized protein n=1 Tax=Dictyobacter kobayashii TaxID=2014872 RepID=A0A402ARI6_9CHLR|nr:hypothetical protein [Dictyobacter kobayashii]GCE21673.1 hypothetical protein KDK_54730 [Dictyobacter kobayashii]